MVRITGGKVYDPANGVEGVVKDICIADGRVVANTNGGTRTIDVGYEIAVENHRHSRTRVNVHDHIPVSTDGDIRVRLRETSPAPGTQTDLGELTWELSLDGGQEATVRYRFTVEHPAQVTVTGL